MIVPRSPPYEAVVKTWCSPGWSNSLPWLQATNTFLLWPNFHYSTDIIVESKGLIEVLNHWTFGESDNRYLIYQVNGNFTLYLDILRHHIWQSSCDLSSGKSTPDANLCILFEHTLTFAMRYYVIVIQHQSLLLSDRKYTKSTDANLGFSVQITMVPP